MQAAYGDWKEDALKVGEKLMSFGLTGYHIGNKISEINDILSKYAHVACVAKIAPTIATTLSGIVAKVASAASSANGDAVLNMIKDDILEPILVDLRKCKQGQTGMDDLARAYAAWQVRVAAEKKRAEMGLANVLTWAAPTDQMARAKEGIMTWLKLKIANPLQFIPNPATGLPSLLQQQLDAASKEFHQLELAYERAGPLQVIGNDFVPGDVLAAVGPNKLLLVGGALLMAAALAD